MKENETIRISFTDYFKCLITVLLLHYIHIVGSACNHEAFQLMIWYKFNPKKRIQSTTHHITFSFITCYSQFEIHLESCSTMDIMTMCHNSLFFQEVMVLVNSGSSALCAIVIFATNLSSKFIMFVTQSDSLTYTILLRQGTCYDKFQLHNGSHFIKFYRAGLKNTHFLCFVSVTYIFKHI